MSINIQTSNGLQKIISENLTKTKVVNALGYTPADYTTLEKYMSKTDAELAKKSEFSGSYFDLINAPDIVEDGSGKINYADENGNVIAIIDDKGVHSVDFYADGTPLKTTLNTHINDNKKHISQSEREYWNNKSEFDGDYNSLTNAPQITENESGSIIYVDEQNNIIAKIDNNGFETTTITVNKVVANGQDVIEKINTHENNKSIHVSLNEKEYWNNKSEFNGNYENLTNAPDIKENENGEVIFADDNNNIIAKINADGFTTTEVNINDIKIGETVSSHETDISEKLIPHINNANIHVVSEDKARWDAKSNFSGDYGDLTNAPDIIEDENGEVIFADDENNIIARLNAEGFQTTKVSANAISLDGNNLSTKLEQIDTNISNTNINLNAHIDDKISHIQPEERNVWNSKLDANQVSEMIATVIDSAPETLNTLNELAAALGDDPNFATTVATEIGKKTDKADFTEHTTNTNVHIVAGEKEYWNDKRYSSLTEAPHILEDESNEVIFADDENNIIAKINVDGFTTTTIATNKITVDGVDATTKFNELNTHVTDIVRHVTQEDKNDWNAKTTIAQVEEIAVAAATEVKNELINEAPEGAQTLKDLNDKLINSISDISKDVKKNTDDIKTNAGKISNNETKIGNNETSIKTINSSITNINTKLEQKVDKNTDLTPWARYDGTVVKIGIDSSKYIESKSGTLEIHDGDKITSWENGQVITNQINATEKVETKEVAIEGGLSLKHVKNDGWYLM